MYKVVEHISTTSIPSQIPAFFTFDLHLGAMFTQNVADYPSQHVTHGPGKFEVAISNG